MWLPRLHLVEMEEVAWVPLFMRHAVVSALGLILRTIKAYHYGFDDFARWAAGGREVLDLGSGSGDHIAELIRSDVDAAGESPISYCLSDLAPDVERFHAVQQKFPSRVRYVRGSLDATRVGPTLGGDLRSMFGAFHHLRPEQARALLADAALHSNGVFIFEPLTRRVSSLLSNVMGLLFGVAAAFIVRPFDWRVALFSTVIPIIPLLLVFDGVVSALRSYTVQEVEAMIASLPSNDFDWQVKEVRGRGMLAGFRCLVVMGRRRARNARELDQRAVVG